jgi:hypothetical protein
MVSSPVSTNSLPSIDFTPVLRYSRVGCSSTFRKSGLFRCASRCSWLVVMLAAWIVAVTDDWSGSSAMVIVAAASPKYPRTLLTIRCRATKPTRAWLGSSVYVPATGTSTPL